MLVIASHAKSGLSEWLLGSVANYLTHHCEAPVLVLHRPKGAEEAGSGSSMGGLRSWLPDLSVLLRPKVRAEAVGAAAVGAAAAGGASRWVLLVKGIQQAAGFLGFQQKKALPRASVSSVPDASLERCSALQRQFVRGDVEVMTKVHYALVVT